MRLFWTTLLAFLAVIVLGAAGMALFFNLAFRGGFQTPQIRQSLQDIERAYAAGLGDYYVARGGTWNGVEQRLNQPPFSGRDGYLGYVLADANGRVLASDEPQVSVGAQLDDRRRRDGTPISNNGARIGTLLLRFDAGERGGRGGPPIFHEVARAFLSAMIGLLVVLIVLAVIFSSWLSRPLRRLTAGAQQLASGDMAVRVPGARVRELNTLADSFNGMAESLARADQQRRQQTADIAHELRTPLTIIKGRLEGIEDGIYTPDAAQVAVLLRETALLERMIEDLRLLALADAGQLPIDPEPVAPRDLLERAAVAFAATATEQGIALHIQAADDLPLINVDPQRMAQVLNNLVSNALRHTPTGGEVVLGAGVRTEDGGRRTEDGGPRTVDRRPSTIDHRPSTMVITDPALTDPHFGTAPSSIVYRPSSAVAAPTSSSVHPPSSGSAQLVITVQDTGSGIAPEDLPQIFDRFWRADRSRTRGTGGSGLGLAITRQIVLAHGGTISADSAPGAGTTITIMLPVAEE